MQRVSLMKIIIVLFLVLILTLTFGSFWLLKDDSYTDTVNFVQQIQVSLEEYREDCHFYPGTNLGLKALVLNEYSDCPSFRDGGYLNGLDFVPDDLWGNKLIYQSDGKTYSIMSLGDRWIVGDNKSRARIEDGSAGSKEKEDRATGSKKNKKSRLP